MMRSSQSVQFPGVLPALMALAALVLAVTPASPLFSQDAAPADAFQPAPPGEIKFVGKNRVATANSVFHQWKVTKAEIDPENLAEGVVEIEIDIASLDTGIPKRDDHLRHADFFEVEKYPTATVRFYDAQPKEGAGNLYTAKMDLKIRDVEKTQDVEFELVAPETFTVKGAFIVLRTDFGVGEPYKKLNPLSIEDEVKLSFEATLLGGS